MTKQISNKLEITTSLVTELIKEQFPKWAHLPIKPVELQGWDNRTFRLGMELSIRLPSAQCYADKVQKEQKWLPILAQYLSVKIPRAIAMGKPSKNYPFNWSIYKWIDGESASNLIIDELYLKNIALQLVRFLNELQKIDPNGGPLPGPHNFYRGGSLMVYNAETKSVIAQLKDLIDVQTATSVWEKALSSSWSKNPVWIHGDLSAGNILIKDNQLIGVIDFGGVGVGDPACDLVIAWTFLKDESREIFKSNLNIDSDTWARARGWALWKALITIASLKNKKSIEAMRQLQIINEVLKEHENLNK